MTMRATTSIALKTLEIARDVVKKLLESQSDNAGRITKLGDNFDYPLVIGI